MTTVIVLPDPEWNARDALLAGVAGSVDVRGDSATEICADLLRAQPAPPLVVVAYGSSCAALPAVAFAQRSARRRVGAYVVVEPHAPPGSDTWPDAPVLAVTTDEHTAHLCRLRGWETTDVDVLAAVGRVLGEID